MASALTRALPSQLLAPLAKRKKPWAEDLQIQVCAPSPRHYEKRWETADLCKIIVNRKAKLKRRISLDTLVSCAALLCKNDVILGSFLKWAVTGLVSEWEFHIWIANSMMQRRRGIARERWLVASLMREFGGECWRLEGFCFFLFRWRTGGSVRGAGSRTFELWWKNEWGLKVGPGRGLSEDVFVYLDLY